MSGRPAGASALEAGLVVLTRLREAPPRTLHVASIVRSSPLSPSVRAMLERREFGRACEASASGIPDVGLPGLDPSAGPVRFLAEPTTLDTLSRSVDTLRAEVRRIQQGLGQRERHHQAMRLGPGPAPPEQQLAGGNVGIGFLDVVTGTHLSTLATRVLDRLARTWDAHRDDDDRYAAALKKLSRPTQGKLG